MTERAPLPTPGGAPLAAWLDETARWVDAFLDGCLPPADAPPVALHDALRYALFGGGKRLRPALCRAVGEDLGGKPADALRAAAALELVHTYSLVHDDLPCMDDDDLRRGRPTVHVVYGEAMGVLVGDALLTLAFEVLGDSSDAGGAVPVLARAAGSLGMVGGQVLDLEEPPAEAAGRPPSLEEVRAIHAMKTAALFSAAAELGARSAGADAARCAEARGFGHALGMAFQAVDDALDVTGDARTLGKTPGKDAALEKRTLVAAGGVEGAHAEAREATAQARARGRALGLEESGRAMALLERLLDRRA